MPFKPQCKLNLVLYGLARHDLGTDGSNNIRYPLPERTGCWRRSTSVATASTIVAFGKKKNSCMEYLQCCTRSVAPAIAPVPVDAV
eukprot:6487188-Amphidinium_carterae.1